MSFAYLIAASRPCPMLAKMCGEAFALVAQDTDLWVYFRFCEGGVYTERSETEKGRSGSDGFTGFAVGVSFFLMCF